MQKKKQAKRKLSRERKQRKPKIQREPKYITFGRLKGQIQIVGDVTSPIDPPEVWTGDLENIDSKPEPQS